MVEKSWRAEAQKRWGKKAEWIEGDGQFALLARCRVLTVTLWATMAEAEERKDFIDITECGGGCFGPSAHKIIDLGSSP